MKKGELVWIKNKIEELKQIYELSVDRYKSIVEDISRLDDKLEQIKEQLKSYGENSQSRYQKAVKNNKKLLKKYIKEIVESFSISSIVLILLVIPQTKNIIAFLLTELIMLAITAYPFKNKYNENKINLSELESLETEYKKTLDKRLSIGVKYREYYDALTMTSNVYKVAEQLLTDKMSYIEESKKDEPISTADISKKISTIYIKNLPPEDKKMYLDTQLKKYLTNKIIERYPNISKNGKMDKLSVEELMIILTNIVPNNDQNIMPIIEFILNYASNMQGRMITLYEEQEDSIKGPEIIYDSLGRWIEIKYGKDISCLTLFQIIYQKFFDEFMKEEQHKTRKR